MPDGNFIQIPEGDIKGRIPTVNGRITRNPTELQKRASELASGVLRSMSQNYSPKMAGMPQLPRPEAEPRPAERISLGQLTSTPDYVTRFLIDLARSALGLPGQDTSRFPIPSPSSPSHGYTIAEGGKPEMVTAEGAYFPFEDGNVIPMESRQEGGNVIPSTIGSISSLGNTPLISRQEGGGVEATTPRVPKYGPGWRIPETAPIYDIPGIAGRLGETLMEAPGIAGEALRGLRSMQWASPYEYEMGERTIPRTELPSAKIPMPKPTEWPIARESARRAMAPTTIDLTKTARGDWEYLPSPEGEMRYRLGPEDIAGDIRARGQILGEIPTRGFYSPTTGTVRPEDFTRLPRRTYYEAHPEERFMDIAEQAERPYRETYLRAIEDARSRMQGFGLPMRPRLAKETRIEAAKTYRGLTQALPEAMVRGAEVPAAYYRYGMEYGPTSPTSQERLAHARYYDLLAEGIPTRTALDLAKAEFEERRGRFQHGPGYVFDADTQKFIRVPENASHNKLFQDIIDRSYTSNIMGQRIFDEEGFQNRIREAVRFGMLPKEWEAMIPKPSKITREQAMKFLGDNRYPMSEANIKAMMERGIE